MWVTPRSWRRDTTGKLHMANGACLATYIAATLRRQADRARPFQVGGSYLRGGAHSTRDMALEGHIAAFVLRKSARSMS